MLKGLKNRRLLKRLTWPNFFWKLSGDRRDDQGSSQGKAPHILQTDQPFALIGLFVGKKALAWGWEGGPDFAIFLNRRFCFLLPGSRRWLGRSTLYIRFLLLSERAWRSLGSG